MLIDDNVRRKALLQLAGFRAYKIAKTLNMTPENEEANVYDSTKDALAYFNLKKNVQFETCMYRSARQKPEKSLDQYQVRLRACSNCCKFADIDKGIFAQIIQLCTSQALDVGFKKPHNYAFWTVRLRATLRQNWDY